MRWREGSLGRKSKEYCNFWGEGIAEEFNTLSGRVMHNSWENTQKITFSVATIAVIVRSLWALSLNFFSTKYA